jgi:hypothetical protein
MDPSSKDVQVLWSSAQTLKCGFELPLRTSMHYYLRNVLLVMDIQSDFLIERIFSVTLQQNRVNLSSDPPVLFLADLSKVA